MNKKSDVDLVEELRKKHKNIWRCADSGSWSILKEKNLLTFNYLKKNTNYSKITDKLQKGIKGLEGIKSIRLWVIYLKKGDLIFVMSKNSFYGIAICKTEYNYDCPLLKMGDNIERPAIEVEYLYKIDNPIKHKLEISSNNPTFTQLDSYNCTLKDTIAFLNDEVKDVYNKLLESVQMKKNENLNTLEMPLNQIYFGPPGTGKTYNLLETIIPKFKQKIIYKSQEIIESEIISELRWWKIIAMVLLDKGEQTVPQIKEHDFVKYKLATSNTKNINKTIWGQLSSHTINESKTVEYGLRTGSLIFDKKESSVWFISKPKDYAVMELGELISELKNSGNNSSVSINNFKFITFHQSTAYENFVEGIAPVLNNEPNNENNDLQYEVKKGAFYKACDEAAKLAGFLGLKDCIEHSKEERIAKFKNAKPYALLIDEINRGNISSILGELITLIEEDKRLSKNEIIVELPYSGNSFGVPPNLYIIGTMNTADRSVESLDTALRRRFSFTEMLPRYDLEGLEYEYAEISGKVILETINKRIEKLLDRDHLIRHSYFILQNGEEPEKKLMKSFYRNIIPLLQEYFYGDYDKIGAILGSGFVLHDQDESGNFADGFEIDYPEKVTYKIIDYRENKIGNKYIQENMSFEKAINKLINKDSD